MIERIALMWEQCAQTHISDNEAIQVQMSNAEATAGGIALRVAMQKQEDPRNKIYVSKDRNNNMQAIMQTKENDRSITIEHLVTCPWNIAPILELPNYPQKGAGTTLIMHVFKQAVKCSLNVELESYFITQPFYAKLGFSPDEKRSRGETIFMSITADRIRQIHTIAP